MQIPAKKILHLPVFTRSGEELGKVSDFTINVDTQEIERYFVKSSHMIEEFFSKELIISNKQVISINKEKIIVDDLVSKEKERMFNNNELRKNKSAPPVSL